MKHLCPFTETTEPLGGLLLRAVEAGVRIHTPLRRDGAMTGPDGTKVSL